MEECKTHDVDMSDNKADLATEDDLYRQMKELEKEIEFLDIQEEYIRNEQKFLKREFIRAKEEVKKIQSVPLVIGQFSEMINENYGI